jgi:DNA-binding response OmpR family regulator
MKVGENVVSCVVVEDDSVLGPLIKSQLEERGFKVVLFASCAECCKSMEMPQCAVVDWNLADGEGTDLLDFWKSKGWKFPIIFLTARTIVADKIFALQKGASDYMTKPFDIDELTARLKALLRLQDDARLVIEGHDAVELGMLKIEPSTGKVFWSGQEAVLPNLEFKLLLFLARSPNLVFTRDEILTRVWGEDVYVTNRTVDNHILQLRKKLHPALIETVWSSGYRLKVLSYLPGLLLSSYLLFQHFLSRWALHLSSYLAGFLMLVGATTAHSGSISTSSGAPRHQKEESSAYEAFASLSLDMKFEQARDFARLNFEALLREDFSRQVSFRQILQIVLGKTTRTTERYPDEFLRLDASNCTRDFSADSATVANCGTGEWLAKLFLDQGGASERLSLASTLDRSTSKKIDQTQPKEFHLNSADIHLPGRTWFGKTLHIRYVTIGKLTKLRGFVIRVFWQKKSTERDPEQFLMAYSANDLSCPMARISASRSTDFYQNILNTLDLVGDSFHCEGHEIYTLTSY